MATEPDMRGGVGRRLATETKQAFKTTEFWVWLVFLVALLIAGTVDDAEGSDFGAQDVWLFGAIVTTAYLISRGLAKSGSRDPYWDEPGGGGSGESLTERAKAAAQVLKEGDTGSGERSRTEPPGGTGSPGGMNY